MILDKIVDWGKEHKGVIGFVAVVLAAVLLPFNGYLLPLYLQLDSLTQVIIFGCLFFWALFVSLVAWEEHKGKTTHKEEKIKLEQSLAEKVKEEEERSKINDVIWKGSDNGGNRFVPKNARRAIFISIVNLKGGVGKTTLTANLGAFLSTMEDPLSVLIVDLDFQGTLSRLCVANDIYSLRRQQKITVAKLVEGGSPDLLLGLLSPMNQVEKCHVIVADDELERHDSVAQARFLLNKKDDPRFFFQAAFHNEAVAKQFDLVLFDCPPRFSTSAVNALTTSDYVLIPTNLDEKSVQAVPRTLGWVESLKKVAQPKLLGVLANNVELWRKQLVKGEETQYQALISKPWFKTTQESKTPARVARSLAWKGKCGHFSRK